MGYSPWGCQESDTTERLHFLSFFLSFLEVRQETKGKPDIGFMTRYSSTSSKFGEDFLYPQDTMTKESY